MSKIESTFKIFRDSRGGYSIEFNGVVKNIMSVCSDRILVSVNYQDFGDEVSPANILRFSIDDIKGALNATRKSIAYFTALYHRDPFRVIE